MDAIEVFLRIVWESAEPVAELAGGCGDDACEAVGVGEVEVLDHAAIRHRSLSSKILGATSERT